MTDIRSFIGQNIIIKDAALNVIRCGRLDSVHRITQYKSILDELTNKNPKRVITVTIDCPCNGLGVVKLDGSEIVELTYA